MSYPCCFAGISMSTCGCGCWSLGPFQNCVFYLCCFGLCVCICIFTCSWFALAGSACFLIFWSLISRYLYSYLPSTGHSWRFFDLSQKYQQLSKSKWFCPEWRIFCMYGLLEWVLMSKKKYPNYFVFVKIAKVFVQVFKFICLRWSVFSASRLLEWALVANKGWEGTKEPLSNISQLYPTLNTPSCLLMWCLAVSFIVGLISHSL